MSRRVIVFSFLFSLLSSIIYFYGVLKFHNSESLYTIEGDSKDYIYSVENLISEGDFIFFKNYDGLIDFSAELLKNQPGLAYSFRSPGFAFFYYPVRLLFSQETALLITLALQIILSVLCKVLMALLVFKYSKSKVGFWTFLIIVNSSYFFVYYNNLLLTESFSISLLFIGLYLFLREKKKSLALSALCLAVSFLLRPFLVPVIAIFLGYNLFARDRAMNLYFLLPLVIIFGSWTVRNFVKTDRIILLQTSNEWRELKPEYYQTLGETAKYIGLPTFFGDKNNPIYLTEKSPISKGLPVIDVTPLQKANQVTVFLKEIQFQYQEKHDTLKVNQLSQELLAYCKSNFATEKHYNRLKSLHQFILAKLKIPFQFKSFKYPLNVLYALWELFVYGLVIALGIVGLINVKSILNFPSIFALFIIGFMSLYFPLMNHATEHRYFLFCYWPMLLIGSISIGQIIKKKKRKLILLELGGCLIGAFVFALMNITNYIDF